MASTEAKKKKNACERCRRSKIRCHLDTFDECEKCRRCFEADKECVFITPPPRKPRKRTDARVTTLEKELAAMKNMFDQLREEREVENLQHTARSSSSTTSNSRSPDMMWTSASAAATPFTPQSAAVEVIPFLLSSSMLSEQEARELFDEFLTECLPQFPVVTINESFDALRETKPMLLLAAITAASNAKDGELFSRLHRHLVCMVSDRVVINGERNVELLQAILLLEVWFCPPEDLRKLNFYQWIHMAATMAMQLGLIGESSSHQQGLQSQASDPVVDDESLRLGLAVYFACSSAAISLKRQKILQLGPSLVARLDRLRHPANCLNDRRLAAWIDLQLITEEACDAPTDHAVLATDPGVLQTRFESWREALDPDIMNLSLLIHFQFVKSKLQELSMQLGSSPDELAPPYLPSEKQSRSRNQTLNLHSSHGRSIQDFAQGCHSLLDTFVIATPAELRHGPTVIFVRAVYGIKGLMLLQSALARIPHLRQVLGELEIQYQAYLEAMKRQLVTASGDFACKVPSKVLELTTFLAERNALEVNPAGVQSTTNKGHRENAAKASVGGNQGLVQGKEGGFVSMATHMYRDSYFPTDGAYEEYGSDVDMLQMPDLGDFSFLVNQDFGFDEARLQDCWSSGDSYAVPGWQTHWQT